MGPIPLNRRLSLDHLCEEATLELSTAWLSWSTLVCKLSVGLLITIATNQIAVAQNISLLCRIKTINDFSDTKMVGQHTYRVSISGTRGYMISQGGYQTEYTASLTDEFIFLDQKYDPQHFPMKYRISRASGDLYSRFTHLNLTITATGKCEPYSVKKLF
jgi:hypothetical protein